MQPMPHPASDTDLAVGSHSKPTWLSPARVRAALRGAALLLLTVTCWSLSPESTPPSEGATARAATNAEAASQSIPAPGTAVLATSGLLGLAWHGRRAGRAEREGELPAGVLAATVATWAFFGDRHRS